MGIWYGVASDIRGHPRPPARFTRVDLLRPHAPPPRPNTPHHPRPPARFTRVDLATSPVHVARVDLATSQRSLTQRLDGPRHLATSPGWTCSVPTLSATSPVHVTRVDLLHPNALCALSPDPPSAQRLPEPQVVLRVLLDLV
jgi:hypothetical protein